MIAVLLASLVAAAPTPDPRISAMQARLTAPQFTTYAERLGQLNDRVASLPAGSPVLEDVARQTDLELRLDEALLAGTLPAPSTAKETGMFFYQTTGGAPDPVAVYVPKPNEYGRYGLAIVLHGGGETETDVISHLAFRQMADRTHTILVAPYAGGTEDWNGAPATEVAALLEAMRSAFPIEAQHVYLVGISKGGAGAFDIADAYAARFSAVMSIMGELPKQDAAVARQVLRNRNVYVVYGDKDPAWTQERRTFLTGQLGTNCVPISVYVAPNAERDLYEVFPVVNQAWSDMAAGIIRNNNPIECTPNAGG
jgi:predicted esterase